MSIDKRATRAIKICLNKHFDNKNSENLEIAKIISSYSHQSILEMGSRFESKNCYFYLVGKLFSPFWAHVTMMPPRSSLFFTPEFPFRMWYQPDFTRASSFHKKRIFAPFSDRPYIKNRNDKYFLQHIHPCTKFYIPFH